MNITVTATAVAEVQKFINEQGAAETAGRSWPKLPPLAIAKLDAVDRRDLASRPPPGRVADPPAASRAAVADGQRRGEPHGRRAGHSRPVQQPLVHVGNDRQHAPVDAPSAGRRQRSTQRPARRAQL